MLPRVSYESLHFHIPAATVNKIAAWILLSDDAYMQSEINKHGVTTAIKYQGKVGFHRLNEVPKQTGMATPYYGTIGGVYNFIFNVQEDDTTLRIRHSLGNQFKLKPYETALGTHIQFEEHSEASNRWFSNRLETIIEEHEKDFRFYIDGEIYANLLAIGWQKERIQEYQYKFIPTTVGCRIIIRHIASTRTFDLTENIDW
ncbi:MAG: hypothetical protein IPG80_08845 [Anaerolineales bacterium]|uniref:hypothetical protein n=1 Tax=Candidatus Villigracilis vicinus TaxID=3140679 RepID=UPI0031370992|nr:hypothetical protein [Anaerolineales bacterium]